MKILIVDDSKAMRRIILRSLRQAGFSGHDFEEAENGRLGLEAVKTHQPGLILSDWNMPEMNGLEFLKALRAEGDKTPFGFITTEGTTEMRSQAAEAGADFLLEKPFTSEQVEAKLGPFVE